MHVLRVSTDGKCYLLEKRGEFSWSGRGRGGAISEGNRYVSVIKRQEKPNHSRDELLNGRSKSSLSSLTPDPHVSIRETFRSFLVPSPLLLRFLFAHTRSIYSLNSLRCFEFLRSSSRYAARKFLVPPPASSLLAWRIKKNPIFMLIFSQRFISLFSSDTRDHGEGEFSQRFR